jgi:hypothetical protein
MFLSKRRGTYYLFYLDESGKRHPQSTHSRNKADEVEFLRRFSVEQEKQWRELKSVTRSEFSASFLE